MGKITHGDLINIMLSLGYMVDERGVCAGYRAMIIRAWLLGDIEEFDRRLAAIERHKEKIPDIITMAKARIKNSVTSSFISEDCKDALDILAFFDGVSLAQSPQKYSQLLDGCYSQYELGRIASVISPKNVEEMGIPELLSQRTMIFDKALLAIYLSRARELLKRWDEPLIASLASDNHSICIAFDASSNQWWLFNPNDLGVGWQLQGKPRSAYTTDSMNILTSKIMRGFGDDSLTVFNIHFYGSSSVNTPKKKAISDELNLLNINYPTSFFINKTNVRKVGPLLLSAHAGNSSQVLSLIKKGTDVLHGASDGSTALYIASLYGHLEVVTHLIEKNADVNQEKNNGVTPLYIAAQNGHINTMEALLANGASVDARGLTGHTPLLVACLSPHTHDKPELFELLLKHGASLDVKNHNGETADDIASAKNNQAFFTALVNWNSYQIRQQPNF